MTEVWIVEENCGDYYNPLTMLGIATSEEEADKLIEQHKASLRPGSDYEVYAYPQQLNVLVT